MSSASPPRERERVSDATQIWQIWSDEIVDRLNPVFYHPRFKKLQETIRTKNNMALGEVVEFSKETWDQKSNFDTEFPYIEISGIDLTTGNIDEVNELPVSEAPSRAKMVVRNGDIIVSTTRPNRGAIAKINKEQDGTIASTGFAILRQMKTDKISKDFLFVMLRSVLSLQQMEQRQTGGNYPAITAKDLEQVRIVVPAIEKQEKITSGVRNYYDKMRNLREEATKILTGAQARVEQMILA